MERTIRFKVEKETKNTVKFIEVIEEGQPPIIDSLYVQKWFAWNATELEVTVKKSLEGPRSLTYPPDPLVLSELPVPVPLGNGLAPI